MKTIAALILASLLAVMGYGIFWMACLAYTTNQMKDAVREAMQAEMTYGTPQWVPDPLQVTMELPAAKLVMAEGPIREIRAAALRLSTSFLMRDRWTISLPEQVEVMLGNGKLVLLETGNGELSWQREGSRLTLRADSVRMLDLAGNEMLKVGDVVLERKASENGVRLNLASRPQLTNGQGMLSGQLVMPTKSFAYLVNQFGGDTLPSFGNVVRAMMAGLGQGELEIENVSFKAPGGAAGALSGKIQMLADERITGRFALTGDSIARVYGWVQRAGLLSPRTTPETLGVARFSAGLVANKGTVRMENMQSTLLLNGQPVGPLPKASQVIGRLWP